ncbi:XdhC family protein [Pelagerythrobacter sp.]|uniref:XdhC family protein n=1 Tax=Pelagerythrobacter sp. TaxID=2800702 RepID=UPI0035AEB941
MASDLEPNVSPVDHVPSVDEEDHLALAAARHPGVLLCTVVGIDGSFSRRLGSQLAVMPDGRVVGNLADGCLEEQLKADGRATASPVTRRYGKGSEIIDFRLPCGGGLDILIDPSPDRAACAAAVRDLAQRRTACVALAPNPFLSARLYIPRLVVRAFGEGPEVDALQAVAAAAGIACEVVTKSNLSLGRRSELPPADRWSAVVTLFHDHEWETALLEEALESDAFYIGAQGGLNARSARVDELRRSGATDADLGRIRSPIGTPTGSRSPHALALSILAEVAGEYERLRPAA